MAPDDETVEKLAVDRLLESLAAAHVDWVPARWNSQDRDGFEIVLYLDGVFCDAEDRHALVHDRVEMVRRAHKVLKSRA